MAKAVLVSKPELRAHAVPAGFPFLLEESADRLVILEPPTLFLFAKFCPIHRDQEKMGQFFPVTLNSAWAVANDLKDWLEFLRHSKRSWRGADQEDFECYRDSMLSTISPHTHRPYQRTTVKRRMVSVLQFYSWAHEKRLCPMRIRKQTVAIRRLLEGSSGRTETTAKGSLRNDILPRTSYSHWEHVRVITPEKYRALAREIGPLPSEARNDSLQCQIRLGVELAVNLGLRIDEIIGLTLAQIDALGPADKNPLALRYLRLARTKGNKPRKVPIPSWLISEINHYIKFQRAYALRHQKAFGLPESGALLLNDAKARHYCGMPLSTQTLRRWFCSAQARAGLVRSVTNWNPETGVRSEFLSSAYRFHDLRHTFAVWLYYAERRAGNPEPWKRIQSVLGHEFLSTTQDIYLRAAGDFEAEVSDAMAADLAAGAPP